MKEKTSNFNTIIATTGKRSPNLLYMTYIKFYLSIDQKQFFCYRYSRSIESKIKTIIK